LNRAWPVAGGIAALALLWPALAAVDRLGDARAARAAAAADLAAAPAGPVTLPAAAFPADDAVDARRRLAAQIRAQAVQGGVLIESIAGDGAVPPGLAALTLTASGPEKALIAFADALERGARPVRFRAWRLTPTPGGVRLDAQAVAPWRG